MLGAAAFLIAEFLKLTYLDVITMAAIPTCLYYWSIFLMVELDAKKFGVQQVTFDKTYSLARLTYLYGFHFISLVAIVVVMIVGYTPIMAVFWATIIAFAASFIRKDTAVYPKKLVKALRTGSIGVLSVASTCAAAGIIVGVVTLTGLGLKFSSIIIAYAGGSLLLTAIYTALIVWVIGLAVPVTASYIIAAVIAAPALIMLESLITLHTCSYFIMPSFRRSLRPRPFRALLPRPSRAEIRTGQPSTHGNTLSLPSLSLLCLP